MSLSYRTGLAAPAHQTRRAILFADVQHGLCNRLRALVSAAVIARATDRELVVIWRRDAHCEARMSDLLRYPGPVIEDDSAADLMRATAVQEWNYMEIEAGAAFGVPVLAKDPGGDVYIRSAYSLVSPHTSIAQEQVVLRGLVPSDAVCDLVRTQPRRADVTAHIRMGTGPAFDHLAPEAPDNWPPERHAELVAWRKASDISRFVTRIDTLRAEGRADTIFVAADLPATYAALSERYGPALRYLPRDLYDRSARQIQYALADLMLLADAPLFLASTGSSFSDVAQRLARPGRLVEQSGTDF